MHAHTFQNQYFSFKKGTTIFFLNTELNTELDMTKYSDINKINNIY